MGVGGAATVPVRGTIAELYLRGRGISSHLPGTLRYQAQGFHPTACRFPSFATSRVQKARFSASCMCEQYVNTRNRQGAEVPSDRLGVRS